MKTIILLALIVAIAYSQCSGSDAQYTSSTDCTAALPVCGGSQACVADCHTAFANSNSDPCSAADTADSTAYGCQFDSGQSAQGTCSACTVDYDATTIGNSSLTGVVCGATLPKCNTSATPAAVCVECLLTADCTSQVCTTGYTCADAGDAANCTTANEATNCNDNALPKCKDNGDGTDNQCVQCLVTADCGQGEVCTSTNACAAAGDAANCTVANEATDCNDNALPKCKEIDGDDNECVLCLTNDDCDDPTNNTCDTTNNTCGPASNTGECTENSECTTDQTKTKCKVDSTTPSNNICVACLANTDCTEGTNTECNSTTNVCQAPTSGSCTTNDDCTDNTNNTCTNGTCGPAPTACTANSGCTVQGEVCYNSICQALTECTDDNGCTSDATLNTCTDGYCTDGSTCLDSACDTGNGNSSANLLTFILGVVAVLFAIIA